MADIELVIKIPEGVYQHYKKVWQKRRGSIPESCIAFGTPLPKGHGDLKDELDLDLFNPSLDTDEYVRDLMAKHNIDYVNGDDEDKVRAFAIDLIHSCMNVIKTAETIIEADKMESEERK